MLVCRFLPWLKELFEPVAEILVIGADFSQNVGRSVKNDGEPFIYSSNARRLLGIFAAPERPAQRKTPGPNRGRGSKRAAPWASGPDVRFCKARAALLVPPDAGFRIPLQIVFIVRASRPRSIHTLMDFVPRLPVGSVL